MAAAALREARRAGAEPPAWAPPCCRRCRCRPVHMWKAMLTTGNKRSMWPAVHLTFRHRDESCAAQLALCSEAMKPCGKASCEQ